MFLEGNTKDISKFEKASYGKNSGTVRQVENKDEAPNGIISRRTFVYLKTAVISQPDTALHVPPLYRMGPGMQCEDPSSCPTN
jgi:hypothetical protein